MLRFFLFIITSYLLFPVSFSYAIEVIDKVPNNILIYHRFNDERYPSTNTTLKQFEDQIQYLKNNNYKFITLSELLANPKITKKSISITVDDAYQSFYEFGFPILKKYNISATLFVSTSSVGSSDHATWNQLKELLDYGIEIQNHTHTHSRMPDQTIEEIENEILTSQKLIYDNLGIKPDLFAYPYGEASAKSQKIVKKYFKAAFGQHSGAFSTIDTYYIPRFPINENFGSIDRIREASSVLAFNHLTISPSDPFMQIPQKNFVLDFSEDPKFINCFFSDFKGSIPATRVLMKTKLLFELDRMPVKGRLRVNCTKIDQNTYWFGYQFYLN
ncbi:polysaccharide deacetylase family protein [Alphaproteobacteria bacterium]|nr:polysaccharide deacetylase family protein [Alphaproteobacteria bacterium]